MKDELAAAGPDYWLRNARSPAALLQGLAAPAEADGLVRLDIRVQDGRIAALAPQGTAEDGIDMRGGQVWPGFVDAHTHLDKGHIWPRMRNPTGDFAGAIAAVMGDRGAAWSEADIAARADFALRCAHAHGTVAIRTHLDTYLPHGLATWRVFRRLREEWAGRIALQMSSICPLDRFAGPDGAMLADTVAESGGVLGMVTRHSGGIHDALPEAFQAELDHFFSLAEARGLDLDLHVDESGETGARALREIALTALRRGFRGKIQCGHCCSLSIQPEDFAKETIALVAEAGIDIVVLPMCNMYLQDRVAGRTPRWRGVTLVHEMRAAGIRVSVASDNTRDPFYAYGDLDMAEVFREATRILHLDHPFGDWPAAAALRPAEAMGIAGAHGSIRVGAVADLVLFSARFMTELLSRPQSDRAVLRAGRLLGATPPDWRELDALLGVAG
ncbi:cytosine deaminase [Falsiroseomonas selenitidurans]|uniref:Cytosine deaminase n=1 Tax=Falsiroseomonas selenitidurans TaxID=2716335 RepID=A0ABX1E1X0_9PROT|nr:cytosine deaminase [Falsiroseomonas selenitidurans]NKC30778.1 cytosine deaminase [Falsiroseomonas selenitidurans]